MSENESWKKGIGYIIAFVSMIFIIIGLLYGIGILTPNNEAEGFLVNLQYGVERWFENPTVVALLVTIFINVFGFLENIATEPEAYYLTKFVETFATYEPLLIVFMQALPLQYALPLAVVIDVVRRIAKARG